MIYDALVLAAGILTGYTISHVYELKQILADILKHIYIPNSLKKISSNKYELSYHHNGKEYKMILPIKRGPKMYNIITNSHGIDVTNEILSYMGPNQDFHDVYFPDNLTDLKFHTITGHTHSIEDVMENILKCRHSYTK